MVLKRAGSLAVANMFCLGLFLLPVSGRSDEQLETDCTAKQEICAFLKTYFAAFNSRDWDAFRNTFDDNITVMFDRPGPPERRNGRAAVEELFRRIFPSTPPVAGALPPPLIPEDLLIQDLGDSAVISFHMRSTGDFSRRTLVLQKANDRWRVVHIHASSRDIPGAKTEVSTP